MERCGWQFFRVRGAEYYSNRIKALEPLWALLRKNEIQKQEPQITNTQTSAIEKIENATVETKQPVKKKRSVSSTNNQSEQIDLFDEERQVAIGSSSKKQIPVEKNKTKKSTNVSSFSEFLVFTSMQNVHKIKSKGFISRTEALKKIELANGEKQVYATGTNNYSGFLLVAFENGKIGKISFTSYQTEQNRKKLKNAFNGQSKLIFIEHIENDIDLVVASDKKKIILFNTEKIHPVDSKTSQGVQVMKPKDGSVMTIVKKIDSVKFNDPEYYRTKGINVVGNYLKQGDEI